MTKIVQKGHPVLRQIAEEVPPEKIQTPEIQHILQDMKSALASQEDGVAIAAPQIGVALRIFIVSKRVCVLDNDGHLLDDVTTKDAEKFEDVVYINPRIIKTSHKKHWVPEGCLSVRGIYGKTHRSIQATVEAYNENGKKFTRGGSGLMAQIFQHETDHLSGILFDDHAKELEVVTPNE